MESMTPIVPILVITVLPLFLAVIAYRQLPHLDIRIGGGFPSGWKIDAAGAVAVYIFIALLAQYIWEKNRPPTHPRWEVFTLHGQGELPEDFNLADYRGAQVQLVLNPPRRSALDDPADRLFDWNVKVPVRVDGEGNPQWEDADWGFREIRVSYPPPVPADQQVRRLVAAGAKLSAARRSDTDLRTLYLEDPIPLRALDFPARPDGGQDGVSEARLEEEDEQ